MSVLDIVNTFMHKVDFDELKRTTPSPIGLYLLQDPNPYKFGSIETFSEANNSERNTRTHRIEKVGETGFELSGDPIRVHFSIPSFMDDIYNKALGDESESSFY